VSNRDYLACNGALLVRNLPERSDERLLRDETGMVFDVIDWFEGQEKLALSMPASDQSDRLSRGSKIPLVHPNILPNCTAAKEAHAL
jgi:hypothetical protein